MTIIGTGTLQAGDRIEVAVRDAALFPADIMRGAFNGMGIVQWGEGDPVVVIAFQTDDGADIEVTLENVQWCAVVDEAAVEREAG